MLIFVYGTLRPRFGHELGRELLRLGEFRGAGTVMGAMYDYGDYPVAIPSLLNRDQIHGEIFDLPARNSIWRDLDEYEDYRPAAPTDSLFERCEARVFLEGDIEARAQIYWFRRSIEGLRRIETGDYLTYRSE